MKHLLQEDFLDSIGSQESNATKQVVNDNDIERGAHCLQVEHTENGRNHTLGRPNSKREALTEVLFVRTRYIDNVCVTYFPVIGDGIVREYDYMNMDEWAELGGKTSVSKLNMYFDIDSRKTDDLEYMLNVIKESCHVFFIFVHQILAWRGGNPLHFSIPSAASAGKQLETEAIYPIIYDSLIRKNVVKKSYFADLRNIIVMLGGKEFSDAEFSECFKSHMGRSMSQYLGMMRLGYNPKDIKNIVLTTEISENSLTVVVPKDKTVSLRNINCAALAAEFDRDKCEIEIDGTLVINSLEELQNIRYIS